MMHTPAAHPYLDIIQAATEPIIMIDSGRYIVVFNDAAERMFLLSSAQATGQKLEILIPAPYREACAKYLAGFPRTNMNVRGPLRRTRLRGKRANSEEFPLEASCAQVYAEAEPYLAIFLHEIRQRPERALHAGGDQMTRLSSAWLHAREEEKKRVVQELHDDIGQALTALSMELSLLQGLPVLDREHTQAHISAMRTLINASFTSLRRIASGLRPAMLDDLGLAPALEWLVSDFATRYGIQTHLHIDLGNSSPSNLASITLYRVTQEALTNVARHAQATQVNVALVDRVSQWVLTIQDDGIGAKPDKLVEDGSGHLGLLGIRERVRILNGTVTIRTHTQQGFRLEVHIPARQPGPVARSAS